MTAIIDYGVGNIFSLCSSFDVIGESAVLTSDPNVIDNADRLILPGVGAFADAANKLVDSGMGELIKKQVDKGKPLLGICLGMQLLFDESMEYGRTAGLGLIKGTVRPISGVIPKDYKIPHIGWNSLKITDNNPLFKHTTNGSHVYFVHSYFADDCDEHTIAVTEYGADLTAAVARNNVFGVQFHPEKSGQVGLNMLKAFCEVHV